MDKLLPVILIIVGLMWGLAFGYFGAVSAREREKHAARTAFSLAGVGLIFLLSSAFLPAAVQRILFGLLALVGILSLGLFFLPIGRISMGDDIPKKRFDERDIMFARWRLRPGSPEYKAYYAMHPENQISDDRTRSKPGLYSPDTRFANMYLFASVQSSFDLTEALRESVDGPVSQDRYELPPPDMTAYLKSLARYYGAFQVGVTALQPYHVYSHVGRGSGEYGEAVNLAHSFALAFTVEMAPEMVGAAPKPPISMESARQYVEAARVAVQLAGAIRYLGYEARAHIDGNYRVIAPLVARDAGLGEVGRMGLLMTPRQGPRVRLGVVTTNANLIADKRKPDPSVIDFCTQCKKCAQNCPSQSIPFGDRQVIDGALRWRINSDTCFHYWNVAGTDCGRCMAVCPYSHPDTLPHNLVRWGIARSGAFRRAALWLDDFFYGKMPRQHDGPEWTNLS
jgi:ferredoxin